MTIFGRVFIVYLYLYTTIMQRMLSLTIIGGIVVAIFRRAAQRTLQGDVFSAEFINSSIIFQLAYKPTNAWEKDLKCEFTKSETDSWTNWLGVHITWINKKLNRKNINQGYFLVENILLHPAAHKNTTINCLHNHLSLFSVRSFLNFWSLKSACIPFTNLPPYRVSSLGVAGIFCDFPDWFYFT